jgi:hypothetical protein
MSFDEGLKLVTAVYKAGPFEKTAQGEGIGQNLSQFWGSLPPEARTATMGAGAGGLGGLAATLLQPRRRRDYLRNALTGSLIGGIGGAMTPAAMSGIEHLLHGEATAPAQQGREKDIQAIEQKINDATDVDPLTGEREIRSRGTRLEQLLGDKKLEAWLDLGGEIPNQAGEGVADIAEAAMVPGQGHKALSGANKLPWLGALMGGYTAAGAGPGHKPFDIRRYKTLADDWLNVLPISGSDEKSKIRQQLQERVDAKVKRKKLFDPIRVMTDKGSPARPARPGRGGRPPTPADPGKPPTYRTFSTGNLLRDAKAQAPPKKPGGARRGLAGIALLLATELGRRHIPGIAPPDSIQERSEQELGEAEEMIKALQEDNL